jgi:hypothetical protein
MSRSSNIRRAASGGLARRNGTKDACDAGRRPIDGACHLSQGVGAALDRTIALAR